MHGIVEFLRLLAKLLRSIDSISSRFLFSLAFRFVLYLLTLKSLT